MILDSAVTTTPTRRRTTAPRAMKGSQCITGTAAPGEDCYMPLNNITQPFSYFALFPTSLVIWPRAFALKIALSAGVESAVNLGRRSLNYATEDEHAESAKTLEV